MGQNFYCSREDKRLFLLLFSSATRNVYYVCTKPIQYEKENTISGLQQAVQKQLLPQKNSKN